VPGTHADAAHDATGSRPKTHDTAGGVHADEAHDAAGARPEPHDAAGEVLGTYADAANDDAGARPEPHDAAGGVPGTIFPTAWIADPGRALRDGEEAGLGRALRDGGDADPGRALRDGGEVDTEDPEGCARPRRHQDSAAFEDHESGARARRRPAAAVVGTQAKAEDAPRDRFYRSRLHRRRMRALHLTFLIANRTR
jgi:hypothetical protein